MKEENYFKALNLKNMKDIGKITYKPYSINVGNELFLGPQAFFSPEIIDKNYKSPLDEIIDLTIQKCPIDYRKRLYANVVFSGGSTSFQNLDAKLQGSLQDRVNERLKIYYYGVCGGKQRSTIKVKVTNTLWKKYAIAWSGGSFFSCKDTFKSMVHTREQYMECGPSCCRFNSVFNY